MPPVDKESSDLALDVMKTFGEEEDNSNDSTEEDIPGDDEEDAGSEEPDEPKSGDPEDPREEHEEDDDEEEVEEKAESQDKDYPKVRADKKGNLIDPKTGRVVAPAGPARRFYESLISTRVKARKLEGEVISQRRLMMQAGNAIKDLKTKLEAKEAESNLPKSLGLSPDEHAEALQVFAKFKNPATALDAIKYVLTKAIQRGIDIKTLGVPANTGLDIGVLTKDIVSQIEGKLQPLTNRLTASTKQEEEVGKVREEIDNFLSLNPEAKPYLPVLVNMAKQPELAHLSLQEAWLRLLLHLRTRQTTQRDSNNRRQPGNGSRPSNVSRPSGRSRPGVDVDGSQVDNSPVDVNTEYKQLVKEVVKDLGGIDFS